MNRSALIRATGVATVLQVAMVVAGHFIPFVKDNLFAVLGMAFSLAGGMLYARAAKSGWGDSLLGGVIAGALSALIGIVISWLLGDVSVFILAVGTCSSAVTGLIGAAIGKVFSGK